MINFTVIGEPVAKGRPKFSTHGGFARAYTPAATVEAERSFQYQALQHRPTEPLQGPLSISIAVYRSKGMPTSKKGRLEAESGLIRPIKKPDTDNYVKLVLDSMNGLFWQDDAQVVEIHASKHYSERPRIEVKLVAIIPAERRGGKDER